VLVFSEGGLRLEEKSGLKKVASGSGRQPVTGRPLGDKNHWKRREVSPAKWSPVPTSEVIKNRFSLAR
jgi:hypothetical protein